MTAGKSHDLFARTDVELIEQICQLPDLKLGLFCFWPLPKEPDTTKRQQVDQKLELLFSILNILVKLFTMASNIQAYLLVMFINKKIIFDQRAFTGLRNYLSTACDVI